MVLNNQNIVTYTRPEVITNGVEIIVALAESDGTIDTTVVSGAVTIWTIIDGERVTKVTDAAMESINSSTWSYIWFPSPTDVDYGSYTAQIELFKASDSLRLFEEFLVEETTDVTSNRKWSGLINAGTIYKYGANGRMR